MALKRLTEALRRVYGPKNILLITTPPCQTASEARRKLEPMFEIMEIYMKSLSVGIKVKGQIPEWNLPL